MKHGRVENGHYPALLGYRTLECGGATKHAVLKQRDTAGGKWLFILCLDNGRTMGSALVQRFITLSSVPQECIGTCFPLAYSLFSTAKCAWIAVLIDLLSDDVDVLLGRLCLMIHKATWLRDLFHGAQSGDNAVWCCSWKGFVYSQQECVCTCACVLTALWVWCHVATSVSKMGLCSRKHSQVLECECCGKISQIDPQD